MKYRLDDILKEYSEKNIQGIYQPVAVGKYGIRYRDEIYKKQLSKDYSKNKIIHRNTLVVGMGSTQIDIGVLHDDVKYSVSPAYHTYKIISSIVNSKYLEYAFKAQNQNYTQKYMIASARQGKTVDLKRMLASEYLEIPELNIQLELVHKIESIEEIINSTQKQLESLDELIKSRFIGQEVYA